MIDKVPVLFTKEDSNYLKLGLFDCYDKERNALNYKGNLPVIAHPPCRLFSRMRAFSTAHESEKQLAYFAIDKVRQLGGVLEHPRSSTLWKESNVGLPMKPDIYGGYIVSVNLNWFGFPAQKKTCLYIVGLPYKDLPPFPVSFDALTHTVCLSKKKKLPELQKKERNTTPEMLCLWLYEVVQLIGLFKRSRSQIF